MSIILTESMVQVIRDNIDYFFEDEEHRLENAYRLVGAVDAILQTAEVTEG